MADKKWIKYEEVARYLLDEFADKFGLSRFESKQKIMGKRTDEPWEIDAKGVKDGSDIFMVVECRRYTSSRLPKEQMGGLAYKIKDLGASGGIIVSPLGLQSGAKKIAELENIHEVILDENSTTETYMMKFLNQIIFGLHEKVVLRDSVMIYVQDKDGNMIRKSAKDSE